MHRTNRDLLRTIGEDPWGLPIILPFGAEDDDADDADDADDSDDADDDDDDDDSDDDDDDDDADAKDKKKPVKKAVKKADDKDKDDKETEPTVKKSELDRVRAALRKERLASRAAKKERDELKTAAEAKDSDKEKLALRKTIREELDAEYKPRFVRQAAKAALMAAGVPAEDVSNTRKFNKMVKLLDMDDIDITDDGEVDGLEDAVAELKDEFPAFFKVAKKEDDDDDDEDKGTRRRRSSSSSNGNNGRRTAGDLDTGNRDKTTKKLNMTQQLMAASRTRRDA